jgi:hypothetical protein
MFAAVVEPYNFALVILPDKYFFPLKSHLISGSSLPLLI